VQKENCKPQSSYYTTIQHNNALEHKRNENAVAGVVMFNFSVGNKSVTAKVKKVEIHKWACSIFYDGSVQQQLLII